METRRGSWDPTATPRTEIDSPPSLSPTTDTTSLPILPETSTPLLRRCTALAARARVDLLTPSVHGSADELELVLAELSTWEPQRVVDPDPTMLALAAASLQDLAERVADPARVGAGSQIALVLDLLHAVMPGSRVTAPA